MKKIIALTIAAAFIFRFNMPVFADENKYTVPDVKAYVLIEAETGEILLSHNESEQLPISSLAKLMTLLLVAEELSAGKITPADSVPVPPDVTGLKAPVIWLEPGEIMSLGELAKAVVINSANDATLALAVYVAGNADEFTARMNRRASELDMSGTFFADPGGFSEDTYSTARDIALMTAELFRHDAFGKFFTTRLSAVREGTERETQLVNTNKLAHRYEGILGGKAGQSSFAGFCTANCARRDDMRLVAVVLGAKDEDDRVNLCEHLLDSGFRDFEFAAPELDSALFSPLGVTRGVAQVVEAVPERPVKFISPRGMGSEAEFEFTLPESVAAPVEEGQVLGKATVRLGEKIVFECDIIALHTVEELTFRKSLEILMERFFNYY
ncbi:MAG: D-alanyl-D-alanine carboxypeptidase [Oscillospiraceae bacterium]|jgi:D-alanyl-D-alanine carboxypeptidase (penicillin-binding protein 5/6)|nr:D-alanyl-D-alanine carboxypeptidase [Oscillospiraceae bacterium]